MSTGHVKDTLRVLLSLKSASEVPKDLVELANSLIAQSQVKIKALKPDEQTARSIICSQLAVESKGTTAPNTKALPIPLPPRTYSNLLNVFRTALLDGSSPASSSPAVNRRATAKRARTSDTSDSRADTAAPASSRRGRKRTTTIKQEGSEESDVDAEPELERTGSPSPSPKNKKPRKTAPRQTTSEPGVVKRRGLAKATDPQPQHIIAVCEALVMTEPAAQALAHAYSFYNNLVKDRWGLLAGLAFTIAKKTQESFSAKLARTKILRSVPGINSEQLEEWVNWAGRIVVDQTWIRRITIPSERRAKGKARYSSGVGNMITYGLSFTNTGRVEQYNRWKKDMLAQLQ